MFERFSPSGRQVIVLAQDEARRFNHNYIGTEHLLLGLLAEPEGVARRALLAAGVTLDEARTRVQAAVGRGKRSPSGHIPFTPSAKKVLELSLREALSLHHDYIGTEHLLLGLIREREGLGARLLTESGVDLLSLRMGVLDLVPPAAAVENRRRPFWARSRQDLPVRAEAGDDLRTTTATDTSLDEARRLAGDSAVGSHHLLLATLSDSTSAAAKALGSLGIDLDQARSALRDVDVAGTTDELPEEAGRRQLVMRVSGSTLVMETADPTLLVAAQAILASSGNQEIRGDDASSRGFAEIWRAWQASLQATAKRADEASPADPAAD